ncbi:unnamed protein product, partial [Rotaria magnacalcarata]
MATMTRHKRLHNSKYLVKQQIISETKKHIQVLDHYDSGGEDNNKDETLAPNVNVNLDAPLIQNIFDFLASDFLE